MAHRLSRTRSVRAERMHGREEQPGNPMHAIDAGGGAGGTSNVIDSGMTSTTNTPTDMPMKVIGHHWTTVLRNGALIANGAILMAACEGPECTMPRNATYEIEILARPQRSTTSDVCSCSLRQGFNRASVESAQWDASGALGAPRRPSFPPYLAAGGACPSPVVASGIWS